MQDIGTGEDSKKVLSQKAHGSRGPSLRMAMHLTAEVSTVHADIFLLVYCLVSGLVDSTIFNAYGTFVSMQTGNTIFLGLGGSTSHSTTQPYGWVKSFVSILCFCLGCLSFSRFSRYMGPLKRVTLVTSFLFQTVIVLVTAAVIQGGVVNGSLNTIRRDIDWWELLPIALLSFQAAGQIVESRALAIPEISTVVVTSMLHDLLTDSNLLAPLQDNVKRNRRVGAFACTLTGAVAGGFIAESTHRVQVPLWIAGGLKLLLTCTWVMWPTKMGPVV